MRLTMPIQMTIATRLMLASWLATLAGLLILAFAAQGQRPAHLTLKMAPARQYALKMAPARAYALKMAPARAYALKMAPARQVLLAESAGSRVKTGLVST